MGDAPLVDQAELGGSLDSSVFTEGDGGVQYLLWKNDGNAVGKTCTIWARQLSADGLSFVGPAERSLMHNDRAWEGAVVEAPEILKHDGRYYLFYSANDCCTVHSDYAVGVARSKTPIGTLSQS